MNESESENPDRIMFMKENFQNIRRQYFGHMNKFFMKHQVFDNFGGFMPWRCEGDSEFFNIDNFISVH